MAHFVQYRPETEWAGREFVVTKVPRDREWFDANFPRMLLFWDACQEMSARPDKRDILVRKRALPVPISKEDAMAALAKGPCGINLEDAMDDPFINCSGVGEDEISEIIEAQAVVGEEREPLTLRVLDGGSVQGPQFIMPFDP